MKILNQEKSDFFKKSDLFRAFRFSKNSKEYIAAIPAQNFDHPIIYLNNQNLKPLEMRIYVGKPKYFNFSKNTIAFRSRIFHFSQ